MNTLNRLLTMVLRGKKDQFNTVLQEELKERVSILLEIAYKNEAKNALFSKIISELNEQVKHDTLQLKLENNTVVNLTKTEINQITKLYESLNNDNKERMLKLLTESQESVNRVLNLARLNDKG